ncbi:type II secretion system F family protein [Ectothiorhodospira lacustris]|uniref:type II secretion system F family protein n=1 Tax=Ectothiorhodospira lacustris TaxID=2899127 RepID=UPI001EE85185|nr:type II secretion system F family protein [Ectothiorhodospira lacustris]MCG5500819.1 type II secretion system F family protein [Ectothiorhodospira lacustris]
MSQFRYQARDRQGMAQRGLLQAAGPREALGQLERRGMTVIQLDAVGTDPVPATPPRTRRIRAQDRILLLEELATLLEAGVSLAEAAQSLESAYRHHPLGLPLTRLRRTVQGGRNVADAFREAHLGLPDYAHVLVESGEAAGRLPAALRDAARQLDYERTIAQDIRNALVYPAFLVGAGTLAVLAIFVIVVPRFSSLLSSGRGELPVISRWVIEGGLLVQQHLLPVTLALAALVGATVFALRHEGMRQRLLGGLARLPLTGPWLRDSETGRWATLLGTLLAHRVPLLDALSLSARALRLPQDRRRLGGLTDELRRGRALSEALSEQDWIAATRINLIRVGERAGELPRMLGELGRLQTESARTRMKALLALIEPVAIVTIGGVIGFIMVAVVLAITSLNTAGL